MPKFYANPYDLHAAGFYFSTQDEYESQLEDAVNELGQPVEEFEIQLIESDDPKLYGRIEANNLHLIERLDALQEYEKPAVFWLVDSYGCDLEEAIDRCDGPCIFEGSALEATYDFIDQTGMLDDVPDYVSRYFDLEACSRDLVLNGDFDEFEYNGTTYTCTTALGF